MPQAVLYARFSPRPKERVRKTQTIEHQLDACRRKAEAMGLTVKLEEEDRERSRYDDERPGLTRAIDSLAKGDVLICFHGDRFGAGWQASMLHDRIREKGARLVCCEGWTDDSPEGMLKTGIEREVWQYQCLDTARKTRRSMLAKQAEGWRMSVHCPYGWRPDPNDPKRMVEDPHEQSAIRRASDLAGKGLSLAQIARKLTDEGYRPRGKRWHRQTLARLLKREMANGAN